MSGRSLFWRAGLAFGLSTLMVVVVAGLLPRAFLVNDDAGLILYLRNHVFTPWISPILVRSLSAGYDRYPGVPWFGLFQYALLVISSSVMIHTCMELVDQRPGLGRVATVLGACILGAGLVLVADGITWTVVAIIATGTGGAAWIAHLHLCHATGQKASVPRALGYGLLVTCGYMLRPNALGAMVAALAPLFGWLALAAWRGRYLPRPAALLAAIAPLVVVLSVQHRIPQLPGAELDAFNFARGQIHGSASYASLDKRAPELLERAGWTVEEYNDFSNWSFIDDHLFTLAKVQRLVDTGGVPVPITAASVISGVREIFDESSAPVWLFLGVVVGTVLLAWLGLIAPRRGLLFGVGYLVFEIAVSQWMLSKIKFPLRVALPFFVIAAFGMFIIVAREIAARPAESLAHVRGHRATVALLATVIVLFSCVRSAIMYIDRPIVTFTPEVRQFFARVSKQQGFVLPQAGLIMDFDPLHPNPFGYSGLPTGWGSFTRLWYDYLARFGLRHGDEILPWMLDNPNAYVLTVRGSVRYLEDWVRRQIHDPRVRFELVDAAPQADNGRPELGRLVTGPLIRESEEWRIRERVEAASGAMLPGPPAVDTLELGPVAFDPPYERFGSHLRDQAEHVAITPTLGGLRVEADGAGVEGGQACQLAPNGRPRSLGVRIPVDGMAAARFELELIDPEHVVSVHVTAQSRSMRSIRWDWIRDPEVRAYAFNGSFTLVPGYPAHQLALRASEIAPDEVASVNIFVTVDPAGHAGFELRRLEIARP